MSYVMNQINGDLLQGVYYSKMVLTPSQIYGMNVTPVQFLPAPGANRAYVIRSWGVVFSFNTTAYTGGGTTGLYYDTSRTQAATVLIVPGIINAGVSLCNDATGIVTLVSGANSINKPLYISNNTAAFATGDSNITVFAFYSIINFDSSTIINAVNNKTNTTGYNVAQVLLSSSQVQNLNATPITIVPAQGSGFAIIPDRAIFLLSFNSVAYSAATLLVLPVGGVSIISSGSNLVSSASSQYSHTFNAMSNYSPTSLNNLDIQVKAGASPGASGDSSIRVIVYYSVVAL